MLLFALAAALAAVGLFLGIRRRTRPVLWLGLVIAACMSAATPFLAREVLIDRCLDAGGVWNYDGLQCEQ
jgi:hypothetical protein